MIPRRAFGLGLASLAGAAMLLPSTPGWAQVGADLNISPKRVVFDPQTRSATVFVFNRGTEPVTYSVDMVDKVMTSDGQIRNLDVAAKAPDAASAVARVKPAKAMLVFTPRRVTLAGGTSQVIRVRVLRPADLPVGEYRSHLTVTAVPPETQGLTAEEAAAEAKGQLAFQVTALFGVSIPVIVRQGAADARAGIDAVSYSIRNAPAGATGAPVKAGILAFQLQRQGASSLFGDVEVRALGKTKAGDLIGGLRGIGVYPEVDHRAVELALTRMPASGEHLVVTFRDEDSKVGEVLATANFTVP